MNKLFYIVLHLQEFKLDPVELFELRHELIYLLYYHLVLQISMASSGPELDLDLLTMRKEEVPMPKVIYTPMCFCGDNCKLVKCNVLGVPV